MRLSFFEIAKKLSTKSDHPHYKFGAVLVSGGRIISTGFNKNKTHTQSNTYWQRIHAELSVILNAKGRKIKGTSLYIYRSDKNGKQAISKPCSFCEKILREHGIKKVYYTSENGFHFEEYK